MSTLLDRVHGKYNIGYENGKSSTLHMIQNLTDILGAVFLVPNNTSAPLVTSVISNAEDIREMERLRETVRLGRPVCG